MLIKTPFIQTKKWQMVLLIISTDTTKLWNKYQQFITKHKKKTHKKNNGNVIKCSDALKKAAIWSHLHPGLGHPRNSTLSCLYVESTQCYTM